MSANEHEGDVTTIEIVVARVIMANGEMAVRLKLPKVYNLVEVLGLLEAAKIQVCRAGGG
jgi:hypothetical protein